MPVLGCRDKGARASLFREKECSLKKALEALQISEVTHEQLKDIGGEDNPIPVSAVHHKRSTKKAIQPRNQIPVCKYCGGKHEPARTKCPAYGKTCGKCGKANHFHTVCLQVKAGTKQISVVQESESEVSESEEKFFAVEQVGTVNHNCKGQFFVPLSFNHKHGSTNIDCQLDTGATCNVISLRDVCAILHTQSPSLQPEASQLKCYDQDTR